MTRRLEALVWTGVLAAPLAAGVQHLLGYGVTEARCDPAGKQWGVSAGTWIAATTTLTALLAVAGLIASITVFRRLRQVQIDDAPPAGRVWFMSACGLVVCPLLLAIILLDGIGSLLLGGCHQG